MRLPTLRQLSTFLAVAEAGSVSDAARNLGLTQPAASQQLRELERILAIRLFERANGRSLLTNGGRALIEPARRAQAAAKDAAAAAMEARLGTTGQLRIGTGASGCIHLLPGVLAIMKRTMPGLTITVTIGDTAVLLPRVESGDTDLALMTLPASINRSLSSSPLFDEQLIALLPAGTDHRGKTISAVQIAALPLIAYSPVGHTRMITDAWFQRAGALPQPVMELGNFEAIKALVSAGVGAAIIPALALPVPIKGTTKHALRPALSRTVGYVMRREKILDRGMRMIISELRKLPETFWDR